MASVIAGALLLLVALWLGGCTSMTSYRGLTGTEPDCPDDRRHDVLDPCRGPATEVKPDSAGAPGYTLHFAEFDDQGWQFMPPDSPDTTPIAPSNAMGRPDLQIDAILKQLKSALPVDGKQRVRLFVYVHGWRHSARLDDKDVEHFHEFLARQAELARGRGAASDRVVGVYVGWRGTSVDDMTPMVPLSLVSFWDRKRAAERVAQGSIRELFARLFALKREVDRDRDMQLRSKTAVDVPESRLRATVIGHSFGASIVFRSVAQALIASFADDLDDGVERVAEYLDSVVLINPAIEAARFEPLLQVAKRRAERCKDNPRSDPALCQRPLYSRPLLAIYTSESDWATHWAFWVGAKAGNLLQREANVQQMEANDNTVGWVHRLVTHELRLEPGGCADVGAGGLWDQIAPPGALAERRYAAPGWSACLPLDKQVGQPIEGARLRHCRLASSNAADAGCSIAKRYGPFTDQGTFDYNGPLWNVRVDKALMDGHNGNWNPKFLAVLHQVLFD